MFQEFLLQLVLLLRGVKVVHRHKLVAQLLQPGVGQRLCEGREEPSSLSPSLPQFWWPREPHTKFKVPKSSLRIRWQASLNLQYQFDSQRSSLRVSKLLFLDLVGPSSIGSTGATWAKILLQSPEMDAAMGGNKGGEPVTFRLGHVDKGIWVAMIPTLLPPCPQYQGYTCFLRIFLPACLCVKVAIPNHE